MTANLYDQCLSRLCATPCTWLMTGIAGFIGGALLQRFLENGQGVRGMENLSTGRISNINRALNALTAKQRANFEFNEADVRDTCAYHAATASVHYALHQAALGSVRPSIERPLAVNSNNAKAKAMLGYVPYYSITDGLGLTVD